MEERLTRVEGIVAAMAGQSEQALSSDSATKQATFESIYNSEWH